MSLLGKKALSFQYLNLLFLLNESQLIKVAVCFMKNLMTIYVGESNLEEVFHLIQLDKVPFLLGFRGYKRNADEALLSQGI